MQQPIKTTNIRITSKLAAADQPITRDDHALTDINTFSVHQFSPLKVEPAS